MRIGDFNPLDRKFWSKTAEPGFSVAKNRWIINNTIKKYEKNRQKKMAEFTDALIERTDAAATYLCGMQGVARSRPIEQYFGKQELAHLRGQDIQNMLARQQEMLIKSKEERHKQKQVQKKLKEVATKGTTYKVAHYAEKKPELKAGF